VCTDPAVLVVDEATGALDPSSGAVVLRGYERVLRDCTAVLITHRLDFARQADRVVVLERGRIAEDGPSLLASVRLSVSGRRWVPVPGKSLPLSDGALSPSGSSA